MTLFTVHVTSGNERHDIEYRSIDECLSDDVLARLLDTTDTEATLLTGQLRLTGTPLRTSSELREALVKNANTILRRIL